jgi:hypothetical protein
VVHLFFYCPSITRWFALGILWDSWIPTSHSDKAKIITAKFKNLRGVLKSWQAQLSNLKTNISNVMLVLAFFGILEEFRDLLVPEWNFGALLMDKLSSLSQQ